MEVNIIIIKKKKESTRKHCVNRNPTQHCNILYQKRTWKRRYTHLLISESSCCRSKNKKQKTPTILSFKYVHQFKLGNKSVKKDSEMLTLLSSGHGDLNGVTSLKPELVLVPWLEGLSAYGAGSMYQEMWPHNGPGVSPSLCMSTQSPDTGRTASREIKPTAPKNWWSLWAGTCLQGPLATVCSLGWGSYLQPPSLGSPHLQMTVPLQSGVHKLGCVLVRG